MTDNGFRYGTRPTDLKGQPEWVYVKGEHTKWTAIRENPTKAAAFEGAVAALETKVERMLDAVRFLRALYTGGHVRKDKVASAQEIIGKRDDPEAVVLGITERVGG
jgi:hypothetical protein